MDFKRLYISCDMEGIGGICSDRHRELGDKFYEWARRQMTRELKIVIEAFTEQGVAEFVVNDAHDYMLNLHIDELPLAVKLISGSHKTDSMMEGLDADFDGAVFVGYHGKCGLSKAVLSHTYSDSVAKSLLNGTWVGETTLNAAFCGSLGVPLLLVSGDDVLAEEVAALETGTCAVITKYGISRSAGMMLHPQQVRRNYRTAVSEVYQKKIAPFRLTSPYQIEVTLRETQMAAIALRIPGTERLDDATIRFRHEDYITTYRAFNAIQTLAAASYLK